MLAWIQATRYESHCMGSVALIFSVASFLLPQDRKGSTDVTRWDEKAGLRRDAVGSQVIDVLEAQEIKETGNEED
jgi:hypothetical protein